MGWKELGDFLSEEEKNKPFWKKHTFIHFGIPLILIFIPWWIFLVITGITDTSIPYVNEIIAVVLLVYLSGSLCFGLCALLSVFLGLLSSKDFKTYYSLVIIWFILNVYKGLDLLYLVFMNPDDDSLNTNYVVWTMAEQMLNSGIIFFAMILIISIMNRFNNMSRKIDEMYKDFKKE